MAENLPPLIIEIQAKTADIEKQLQQVESKVKDLGSAVEKQKAPVEGLGSTFVDMGKKIAGAFAGLAVIDFLKDSAKAAQEDAASQAMLERQLKASAGATSAQVAQVDKAIAGMQKMAGVADDDIRPAMAQLTRATGDVGKATDLTRLALDVSAGTGKDLTTVSKALGMAYQGNSAALSKLGINVKDMKDPMGALQKQFEGAAKLAADKNPYQTMAVALDDIKEKVGKGLLPVLKIFANTLEMLTPVIDIVSKVLTKVVGAVTPVAEKLLKSLMPAFNAVAKVILVVVEAVLPPLITILNKVVIPVINFLAGIITNYLAPAFTNLMKVLGPVASFLAGALGTAFQKLLAWMKPVVAIFQPLLDGLAKLMGIKLSDKTMKVKVDTTDLSKIPGYNVSGLASNSKLAAAGAKAASAADKSKAAVQKLLDDTQAKIDTAYDTYNTSVAKAVNAHGAAIAAANEKFATAQKEAIDTRDKDLADLTAKHNDDILKIQADYAARLKDVVRQSMDELRSAFANATKTDIGSMFADMAKSGNASAEGLIASMRDKLSAVKNLASNAAALAGAGFSQEFIQQVVAQGPDVGSQMAKSILDATPENQKQLQDLFDQTQTTSAHGMDALAQEMYDKSGLATEALRKLYADTQAAQVQALADEATAYANAQADIQAKFNSTMEKITADRDQAIKDANDALDTALKDATDVLNAALDDAEKSFQDKLKTMGSAVNAFKDEIAALKAELSGIDSSKIITPISGGSVGAPSTSPSANMTFGGTGVGLYGNAAATNFNVTNNISTSTNATASDIAAATANAIKLGQIVGVTSTGRAIGL